MRLSCFEALIAGGILLIAAIIVAHKFGMWF